jgi:TolB-like protein/Flp pilus assembly protein TadD
MENLSHNPKQEYFSDGMTEALITELGRLPALRVISRQSVMQYKVTAKTVPQIARELNVDAIVEGAALQESDKVRISTQLIRAEPEEHLWAASYEHDLRGVIALQRQIASDIAAQINVALTSQTTYPAAPARPVDAKALEAYLQGSYALSRVGLPNATAALYFRQAIAFDPNYAPAHVGLCLATVQMGLGVGPVSPQRALAEAKGAALQAVKLDATLGEAHSCLAWVKAFGEWDWSGADSAFRKAVKLSPNSVQAHRLYSWYLSAMGRHEKAIAEGRQARELDPLSLAAGYTMASSYWWARRYQSCAAEAVDLERMDPTFPGAQALRGLVYLQTGSYNEAVSRFERALRLSEGDLPVWSLARLGCAYSQSGRRDEALHVLDELLGATHQYISPYAVAFLYTSLGNKNKAFEWLEKAYAERNPMLAFLKVEPMLDPLRSDPRYADLLRRINFPR